jgi:predicted phage terminase large subunit-like protein
MTPQEAARALLTRKSIRASFEAWCRHCGFEPAAHHRLLIAELEKVVRGETKRLAFFLPPGSAKSTYTHLFVAWYLAQYSEGRCVIGASHTDDLADKFSRRIRDGIAEHSKVLGFDLRDDTKAAGYWETTKGDEYYAAGVGGTITGRRADLAVIDDPVKGKEDADSELLREKKFEWYEFDLETRLKPEAPVILIQTRWHEEDLAGKIFADEKERSKWRIVSLPMVAEENDPLGRRSGDRLWPEYFTEEMVEAAQRNPRKWSSLYQQHPTPEEGDFFKKEWLMPYDPRELPSELQFYVASDHALDSKDEHSRTCLVPAGLDASGVLWILPDIWWQRSDSHIVVEAMLALMQRRKPLTWWAEKGHISKSIGPFLRQRMRETQTFVYVEEVTPAKSKEVRAGSIQGRMSNGMVRFPTFATNWWAQAREELLTFPHGKHDDFVDTIAHLGMGIDRMVRKQPTVEKPKTGHMTFAWLKETCTKHTRAIELARDDT